MLVEVSSLGAQPDVGSADELLVSRSSPATLSLTLGRRERLEGARLVVRPTEGSGLATPSILLDTVPERSTTGVEQLTAAWGEPRRLQSLALALVDPPEHARLRVRVACGAGRWQPATGSAVTALGDGRRVVTFDETVADRVRVELRDTHDWPLPMSLQGDDPLELELGNEPHDLSLAVRGRAPLLRWAGPIPAHGLVVDDLVERLGPELSGERGTTPLVLELRAEVAGDLALSWEFRAVAASAAGRVATG